MNKNNLKNYLKYNSKDYIFNNDDIEEWNKYNSDEEEEVLNCDSEESDYEYEYIYDENDSESNSEDEDKDEDIDFGLFKMPKLNMKYRLNNN